MRRTFLLVLTFTFFCVCLCIDVIEPENIKGKYRSAYISFNRDNQFVSLTAVAQLLTLVPNQDECQIPSNSLNASVAPIVIISETNVTNICKNIEIFYQLLQQANFQAVVVGTRTFYSPGKSVGFPLKMDIGIFSLPVTYLAAGEFKTISDQAKISNVVLTIDTDLGAFHALSISPGFNFFRFGFPIVYFILMFYGLYLFALEVYRKGWVLNNLVGIVICMSLMCLVRGIKMAVNENEDYYMFEPRSLGLNAASGVFFWFPLVIGTTAYTLTAFAWISTISSIETNSFVYKIRKPMLGFFISLIPVSIILPAIQGYINIGSFFILSACIALVGVFETVVFVVYGLKILKHLGVTSKQMNSKRSALEKKLTVFVMGAVFFWVGIIIISLLFVVLQVKAQSKPDIFPLAVFRDIFVICLTVLILLIIKKKDTKVSTTTKNKSKQKSNTQNTGVSAMSLSEAQEP